MLLINKYVRVWGVRESYLLKVAISHGVVPSKTRMHWAVLLCAVCSTFSTVFSLRPHSNPVKVGEVYLVSVGISLKNGLRCDSLVQEHITMEGLELKSGFLTPHCPKPSISFLLYCFASSL